MDGGDFDILADLNNFCNSDPLKNIESTLTDSENSNESVDYLDNIASGLEPNKTEKIAGEVGANITGDANLKGTKRQCKLKNRNKKNKGGEATALNKRKDSVSVASAQRITRTSRSQNISSSKEDVSEVNVNTRQRRQENPNNIVEFDILLNQLGKETRNRSKQAQPPYISTNLILPAEPPPVNNQRGRARRRYIAEMTARLNPVDCVDLVSSPFPHVTGQINLESDDEDTKDSQKIGINTNRDVDIDLSFDSDNPEIFVKINWNGKIEKFAHRKHQKFIDLLKLLAERENVDQCHICLNLMDRIINADDSPDSINYMPYDILKGRVIKNGVISKKQPKDKHSVELKIQSDKWSKPLVISIKKDNNFKILYIKCAEELAIPVNCIKLSFDGELLNFKDTPTTFDMEGGEVIDCTVKTN